MCRGNFHNACIGDKQNNNTDNQAALCGIIDVAHWLGGCCCELLASSKCQGKGNNNWVLAYHIMCILATALASHLEVEIIFLV